MRLTSPLPMPSMRRNVWPYAADEYRMNTRRFLTCVMYSCKPHVLWSQKKKGPTRCSLGKLAALGSDSSGSGPSVICVTVVVTDCKDSLDVVRRRRSGREAVGARPVFALRRGDTGGTGAPRRRSCGAPGANGSGCLLLVAGAVAEVAGIVEVGPFGGVAGVVNRDG